jgi:ABC-2 type transport system ATP-binding protein
MHIITAQLFASSGELKVFGENPYENDRVLSQICFIKESQKYPDIFRIVDVLEIAATLYPNWDSEFANALLRDFNLPPRRKIKKLSRGMLSSVGIIVGLASRAPLTIFDEPYLGLDAVARSMFYERLLNDYNENPRTIILSTHLIDEVSKLLEHVIVLDRGEVLINEEAETLRGLANTIVGANTRVAEFTNGKKVVHQEAFGSLATATVLGTLENAEQNRAHNLGLEIAPVSLQQLIVQLTTENLDRKVA